MGELRTLAIRFLRTPRTTQKGIIADLGLREANDHEIPPRDYSTIVLARVRAAGKIPELREHPALAQADVEIRRQER